MSNSDTKRHDGDSWDLASSVGATATAVAARRAMASKGPNPLIDDPFAEPLVTAVGVDAFIRMMNGEIDLADDDPAFTPQRLSEGMAVRTRFFDAFCRDAVDAGVRQVVILASGLDTRAYRLSWPAATVVYEVDQPGVIEFKNRTLADLGAAPAADRRAVAVDLRDDWPAALKDSGLDPTQPTAWIAEGLLAYLPPDAQDRLFDSITALSAGGSRLGTGYVPDIGDRITTRGREISERWRRLGLNLNWADLIYDGERNDVAVYLADRGWHATVCGTPELYADNGFEFPEDSAVAFGDIRYLSAVLPGGAGSLTTRSAGDSWDLASSVGATATMVAAARALASEEVDAIISDPFAAPLVRAVGVDFFTRLIDGDIPEAKAAEAAGDLQLVTNSIAVRTRFFDEFFLAACDAGIRQIVILAAGLDARTYRLSWPRGTVAYEIDQPQVIEFKNGAMSALGATPAAHRKTVSVDLRDDWPNALRRSGFDDTLATAWSAEGLLMYLPPDAQDRLFDSITALSAPGSKLATEYHPDSGTSMSERAQEFNQRWVNLGCDIDLSGLFFDGDRTSVVDYLTDQGWRVQTRARRELSSDYGRVFPDDDMSQLRNIIAVTATL